MKRLISIVILSILFLVPMFFCGCDKNDDAGKSENNSSVGALRVETFTAKIGDVVQTIRYSGILKGYREVPVAPGMSSWITKILVKEGDMVTKGQLLARLSPEQLNQAEAQYGAAEDNYNRMNTLLKQGSISQQQFDQIEAGYKAAKAGFELAAKNTELRAPFSGIVASVDAEEGQFFNAMMPISGMPSILTIVDQKRIKMESGASDRDIIRIARGQKAFIITESFPDSIFWGNVEQVEHIADRTSGTYNVTTVFQNKHRKLRSGMYATIYIVSAEEKSTIVIPQSAVIDDTIAFVADGNKARLKKISLGIQGDSLVQVLSGIKVGEPVIVVATLGLFEGAPIAIRK